VEIPPPGSGFETARFSCPAVAIKDAGIDTERCCESTYVVTSDCPAATTVDCGTKPLPTIKAATPAEPATKLLGEIEATPGVGFNTVICSAFAPPPGPGFETAIASWPAVATEDEGIDTERCCESTNVATTGCPPTATLDCGTKPLPDINAETPGEPTITLPGEMVAIRGVGFNTTSVPADEPPPG